MNDAADPFAVDGLVVQNKKREDRVQLARGACVVAWMLVIATVSLRVLLSTADPGPPAAAAGPCVGTSCGDGVNGPGEGPPPPPPPPPGRPPSRPTEQRCPRPVLRLGSGCDHPTTHWPFCNLLSLPPFLAALQTSDIAPAAAAAAQAARSDAAVLRARQRRSADLRPGAFVEDPQ